MLKILNLLDDWGESVGYHSEGNEKGDDEDDTGGEDHDGHPEIKHKVSQGG